MKWAVVAARTLLGLIFFVFGLNGFLMFIPFDPSQLPERVQRYMALMVVETQYLYVVKALEVFGGMLLLSGRFVPLGLSILTPIAVNILLFEVFFAAPGMGVFVLGLCLFLIWAYRSYFAPVFTMNAKIG